MQALHRIACRVCNPRRTAEMVSVVPISLAGVLLTVSKAGEVGMLGCSVRNGGVEHQYEAVGAAHLAVGRGSVRHGRGQSGEVTATNLRGDALALGIVVLGVAFGCGHEVWRGVQCGADIRLRVSHVSARNLDRAICRAWSHHFSTEQKYKIICSV